MPSSLQVNTITSYSTGKVLVNDQLENGTSVEANGNRAHAQGVLTQADGDFSHAEGRLSKSNGYGSHAEGDNCRAEGNYSHAEGEETVANGVSSHAEGENTNASGNYSHAEGYATNATAIGSHAEGRFTIASELYAHAEGASTEAEAAFAHAEGNSTKAKGGSSHAEGFSTISLGGHSHAEGNTTQAQGEFSHSEGAFTEAIGESSHAEGFHTKASGNFQHVCGKYNDFNDSTEAAFIIGNGDNITRSNLLLAAGNEVQVFGKTSTETIQISNGAFDGYVLTSDALGNGSWQSIGALSDTFVTAASLNGTDLEIDRNNGQPQIVVDLSSLVTPPGIDTFVTNAGLNGLTLEIDRNQGQPQLAVDLSSLAVDTNNYLTNATLNGTLLELDRFGLSTLTVDLASINTDTFVVSGAYDDVSNTITLTRNDAGTIDITGIADSYVTGAVLNGSTLELARNEGLPTLSVDLSPLLDDTTATVDAAADPNVNVDVVFYSASIPGGTIYLNSALNVAGKKIVLVRTADTNAATLAGSIGTQVNGSSTKALPTALYSTTTCISDGTNWYCTNGDIL